MTIHYFQHVAFEDPGSISEWALQHHHTFTGTRWYAHETAPDLSGIDMLIIMGGPMSVHDEAAYPWLAAEKAAIAAAIQAQIPILGICLGAQLIAHVMGAPVYPHTQKEIGWFPVSCSTSHSSVLNNVFPEALDVFHWHGDTFGLPAGATLFASTPVCSHQGFICQDRIVGLQFHLEVTPASLENMISNGLEELNPAPFIQYASEMLGQTDRIPACRDTLFRLLDHLAAARPALHALPITTGNIAI